MTGPAKAHYLAMLVHARTKVEGWPETDEVAERRIQLEIEKSGWDDVTLQDVLREMKPISSMMKDCGKENALKGVRAVLRKEFGIIFPE